MAVKIETSKRFTIDWRDAGRGLIVAIGTSCLTALQTALDDSLRFNWKAVVAAGIAGAGAYLLKNFFSPSQIVIKEDKNPDGPIKTMDV